MPMGILEDPHHRKEDYRILRRMTKLGCDIPDETLKLAYETATTDLKDADSRVRSAARKYLLEVMGKAMEAEVHMDKARRLDEGSPTENSAVRIDYGEGGKQWTKGG